MKDVLQDHFLFTLNVSLVLILVLNLILMSQFFLWLGMVFTKCLDVTNGSLKVIRWLLRKSFLRWALSPALPTVVLVSFNHVTTLAFVQLGIQNNYSNNLSLEIVKGALTSPKHDSPANWVTRSFDWLGEADPVLPDWQNPVPRPSGPKYLYLYGGGGAIPSHRLHMCEPWITQACGLALMVPLTVSTDTIHSQGFPPTMPGVGGETGWEDLIDLDLHDILP